MVLSLDHDLDGFFGWLDKTVGLKNVWLSLSADHGIAPVPAEAAQLGIHSGVVDMQAVYASLNTELNARYSPGKKVNYLMPGPDLPYLVLNKDAFQKAGADEKAAEDAVAAMLPATVTGQATQPDQPLPLQHRLPPAPQVAGVYTRLQLAYGQVPPSEWGRLLAHSYSEHGNWYVMLVLGGYRWKALSPRQGPPTSAPGRMTAMCRWPSMVHRSCRASIMNE